MPEENQNMGKSVSILNSSSLRDYANSIIDFQRQARQEQMAKASAESDNNIKNLMTSWMATTNHWVSQDCDRAARIWLVAQWVRKYFAQPENWWIDYSNVPDVDLVDSYKASNPDSEEAIWQFVLDDSQICDPNPLYQELGFYWEPQVEEEVETMGEDVEWNSSIWANITQSLIDIPMNLAKLPFNLIDKGTAWLAKKVSDDDEAIDQELQENLQQTENFATLPWVNREDLSYQIPNFVWDLWTTVATSFIPWVWEAKWAEWAMKYPKLASLIKSVWNVEKLIEKYPKLAPFLKGGKLWVKDTAVMNALEWEWTTPLEALEWRLAWWVVEKWIQWLKWLGAFIQTNGLLTPSKAERIVKRLKDIWNKAPWDWTIEDLADFMTKHWLNGTREQIIKKAEQLWKDKKIILDELLSQSTSTHSLEEADEALELLIKIQENWLENAPMIPREQDIVELSRLLGKTGKYTLSDLEAVKMKIDDLLNLYSSKTGNPLDNKTAELWRKTRKKIQTYIEDVAKEEKLWDVAMLNNEIQTSYAIADWVREKGLRDSVKWIWDAIWAYSIPVAWWFLTFDAVKDLANWDLEGAIKKWIGAALINSTFMKTHLWSLLNRMSGTTRYEVQQWIDSDWRSALSNSASKEFGDILKKDKTLWGQLKELGKQYMTQFPKESAIIWGQKWIEEWAKYVGD